jgi:methylated-DNA-[protein]-cysteine S-methyltransferase
MVKYTIFRTKWGYFGLAATDNGLLRTSLPTAEREKVKSQLLCYFPSARYDKDLFKTIQKQITAYFEGDYVDFRDVPVVLNTVAFAMRVLDACRSVTFGKTISYGQLAEFTGSPAAARAAGTALSKNPLPLIIPCHRVICADGSLGGFSVPGGVNLKKRLLELEARSLK